MWGLKMNMVELAVNVGIKSEEEGVAVNVED